MQGTIPEIIPDIETLAETAPEDIPKTLSTSPVAGPSGISVNKHTIELDRQVTPKRCIPNTQLPHLTIKPSKFYCQSSPSTFTVSPMAVMEVPLGNRKITTGPVRGKTAILTESSYKNEFEELFAARNKSTKSQHVKRKITEKSNKNNRKKDIMAANDDTKAAKKNVTTKSTKKKKKEKSNDNSRKRKNNSSPEPSTSSKPCETKVSGTQCNKKIKCNSDELDESQSKTSTKEPLVKFSTVKEERNDRFQLETLHRNLQFVAIDEICLEGLDGITLQAFWTRLSVALNCSSFPVHVMNFFWNIIVSSVDIECFKLESPRPELVIYDRFKERDSDFGEIIDPIEAPLDIYPYSPVLVGDVLGSASSFNSRINVTVEVRQLSLSQAEEKYGSQLVLVGTQKMRKKVISNPLADPVAEYTLIQYCLLERIARSRYLGEITQGKVSLQAMSKDPKVIFYNRKILAENYLITKQPFNLKTRNGSHSTGTLFHIVRFYKEHKTKTITMTQQIVDYLRNKPHYRMEYAELKIIFGDTKVLGKLFKMPEFQRFVKTDVPRFGRELYPDNSDKWLCVGSNKEKVIKTLELIDPTINVAGVWYEDDPKDESSDDETTHELMFKIPILHQVYDFIRQSGSEGCSLKEIQVHKGLDFYSTRAAINQLLNQKVISGVKIDIGRQRFMRYQIIESNHSNCETNVKNQEEKKQLEVEATEFLSALLEVDPEHITKPCAENNSKSTIPDSHYTHIKKLRQQSKQNPEKAATLSETYKNEHEYTTTKSIGFGFDGGSIPEHISESITRLSNPCSNNTKRKRLVKFYQTLRQTNQIKGLSVQSIINIHCPLVYQNLTYDKSYRSLLNNGLKLSRVIFTNCGCKLKHIVPKMRYMCKQQLSWDKLQALMDETQLVINELSKYSTSLKRKPEASEECAKKLKLDEEVVAEVKEMFMGPKPTLAYEYVDLEDVSVAVWISTVPEEFVETDLPYIKENNATLRTVKRSNLILDAVKRESIVTDIYSLHKDIHAQEQKEGYNVKADRKSFQRIYTRLVRSGLIKILQIVLKSAKTRRAVTVLCDPSLDVRHSIIESIIEQLKMKIFVPKKKATDEAQTTEAVPFNTSEISSSVGELKMLAGDDLEYTYKRSAGKEYGYVPKFLRMRVLHEFLFHVIYNITDGQVVRDADDMFKEFDISLDEDDVKQVPTVYSREIGWKMFVPPLPKHVGWSDGWALVCDIVLRLPLCLFVKLCNITIVIPDLPLYLEHPVKQYYLVKHLPSQIRNGLLHRRKYIYSVHETLCHLAYIGLLQFGPQKLREKDQVFIFLNRNASLYDTRTTSPGYHYVENKEYKKLQYRFLTNTDVETYWYEMWNICTHTSLGIRNAVLGTYITIEQLEAKAAMLETLKPQTAESASCRDTGEIPGDRKGAAGLDSAIWAHVKRNWNVSKLNRPAASTQSLTKLKQLRKNKKRQLKREVQNKKPIPCSERRRKAVIVRKVCGKEESLKKKKSYDVIDKKLMENLKQSRPEWNDEEDLLLNISKVISTFLCPNYKKQIVYYIVIRDALHSLVPCSVNKTSGACQRRLGVLSGSIEQQEYLQKVAKALTCIPFVKKYFKKFYDHVQTGKFLKDKQLHGAFVLLVVYFFENQNQLQHVFETIDRKTHVKPNKSKLASLPNGIGFTIDNQDSDVDVFAYDGLEKLTRSNKTPKLYPDLPQFPKLEDDVTLDTIKSIIHSTVAVRPDDISCVYQMFRVYQGYSDDILKTAVNEIRNSQMMIAKRTAKKQSDMKGLPITSKLFHFSFYYGFTQVTKFPAEVFLEAHELLLGIYTHCRELASSSDNGLPMECFQQGHAVALSEIVTNVTAHFIVDFPKEVLILNPRIADHTELIRELAIRYKKMLTLVKDGSYFKDDQQIESTEKQYNRASMIQRFLKTWFLSNDDDDVDDITEETTEANTKQDKKRKRNVHISSNLQILKSLNDDLHEQTSTKRSHEILRTVHDDNVESFEDYEKKLENLLSSEGTESVSIEAHECSKSVHHESIWERYINKGKEIKESEPIATETVCDVVETDSEINARMASIIKDDLSVEEVMKEMVNDSPSEERKVPNIIKLSRLLVKGLFPDLDEDEERLERLHQHFLVVCPDTNLIIDNFENNADLTYLYSIHPSVCKSLLCKVQKDIIVYDNLLTEEEIAQKFKALGYSDDEVSVVESLIEFILKKKVLGASSKELKNRFSTLSKQKLSRFLNILIEMNVIMRTGIIYTVFVHSRHRKQWLVESCALEYQDKMKLQTSNTEEASTVDIPTLAKSLDSYTEMKLHIRPWARIDGSLNLKLFEKWLCTVLGHCLADMCVSLTAIITSCTFLKPVDVYYLVECLQDLGCVRMNTFLSKKCWLTTESDYVDIVPATIVDEFKHIFIDTDKLAIIKFGTLLNKKLKEFDFPTDQRRIIALNMKCVVLVVYAMMLITITNGFPAITKDTKIELPGTEKINRRSPQEYEDDLVVSSNEKQFAVDSKNEETMEVAENGLIFRPLFQIKENNDVKCNRRSVNEKDETMNTDETDPC
ncbi:hypothetical protein RN001_000249 [Aquatica leii]|uniref:General transcription factor 3C polypeptide 1 n=1 Tax=Aquatica leii TaxID=1421715 RepID=A0AAN7SQH6_9COLE|nr:hypothetical protein RN001_000249 [Aquatica leii]